MDAAIFLYITLYILLFTAWILSDHDILSPSFLVCASFTVGFTLYLMGARRLAGGEFTWNTTLILIAGVVTFIVTQEVVRMLITKRVKRSIKAPYTGMSGENAHIIETRNAFLWIIIVVSIITAFVQFRVMRSYTGGSTFAVITSAYRTASLGEGASRSSFVVVFLRLIYAINPIAIFTIFYNRIVCRKNTYSKFLPILYFVVSVISLFIASGARGTFFSFIFSIITCIAICLNAKGNVTKTKKRKNRGNRFWIRVIGFGFIVGIPIFYYSGVFIGKHYSMISPLQSVENYFSYGIIRFNRIVNYGFQKSENFGQWSFPGIYSALNKLGYNFANYDTFPFYLNYGNTVTLFGRWYVDFGITGMLILTAATSAFLSYLFYKMKTSKRQYQAIKFSLLYMFYVGTAIIAVYDNWIRSLFTINGALQLIVLLVSWKAIYTILTKKRIKLSLT